MQISDLNNSLSNILTDKNVQKTTNESSVDFSELLSVVGKKEDDGVLKAEYSDIKNSEDKSVVRSVKIDEVKTDISEPIKKAENEKTDVKKTYRDEKTENNNERNPVEKTSVEYAEKEENFVSAEKTFNEQKEDVFDGDVLQETAPVEIVENDVPMMVPVVPIAVADTEKSQIEDETLLLSEEMPVVSMSEKNVSEISDAVVKKTDNVVKNENVNTVFHNTATPQPEFETELNKAVLNDVVSGDENVIQIQEAKIAELLPENKKLEIKVNVTQDTVTNDIEKHPLIDLGNVAANVDTEIVDEKQVVNDKQVINVPEVEADLSANENKVVLSVPASVSYTEIVQPVEFIKDTSDAVSDITKVTNISSVVAESKSPVNVLEKNTFKDIYDKGLTREVAEQIKVNITQSAIKGVDKIEIQLKPEDLGQIEIKLQIGRDGRLHAHIVASNAETLDILQKDFSSLKEAFNNAGYQADDNSFSFGYRGENQENKERQQLREFIGEVITRDIEEETAANDYIRADGVNIRV